MGKALNLFGFGVIKLSFCRKGKFKMNEASQENIKVKNIIICFIDGEAFDCNVLSTDENAAHVVYLEGYKSRNTFVPYKDIAAKLDKRKPRISVANGAFEGNFLEFKTQ